MVTPPWDARTLSSTCPSVETKAISSKEQQWLDVESGALATTFVQTERLVTTTRGGPPISDVHSRTVWSLSKGKVIDDCLVDDVSDEVLNRNLDGPDDISIELSMEDALSMYERSGEDMADIYSRQRIALAAAECGKKRRATAAGVKPRFDQGRPRHGFGVGSVGNLSSEYSR